MSRIIVAALLAVATGSIVAQPYPCKSVRYIVPAAAGGTTDIVARITGQKLAEALGVPVPVDNRAGAGGIIGAEALAKSAPDGCTIMMGNIGPNAINASLYRKLPYDAERDFTPITQAIGVTNALVVHPSVFARSLKEFIAFAKARPGQLTFASSGTGQSTHLSGELFKTMAGLDYPHVPYKGSAPAMLDLVGGHVSFMFENLPTAYPHIKGGKIRVLGVTAARRARVLPDVPTIAQAGLPGYEVESWFGVFAPAGAAKPLVDRLHAELVKALAIPDVRQKLEEQGADIVGSSPEQFAAHVKREIAKWAKVVKDSGARVE
jgi:tripartite-type tricarboxylate transporter receptor subunit TctC